MIELYYVPEFTYFKYMVVNNDEITFIAKDEFKTFHQSYREIEIRKEVYINNKVEIKDVYI